MNYLLFIVSFQSKVFLVKIQCNLQDIQTFCHKSCLMHSTWFPYNNVNWNCCIFPYTFYYPTKKDDDKLKKFTVVFSRPSSMLHMSICPCQNLLCLLMRPIFIVWPIPHVPIFKGNKTKSFFETLE